jgi:hypothetical protein
MFSFESRERVIRLLIKLNILHGSVHELFDALSPRINHEISESLLKEWFAEAGLEYRQYVPQWAKGSRDLFATGKRIS